MGDRPGPIFAILYRSRRHRKATRIRFNFQKIHESSMISNDFADAINGVHVSSTFIFEPKFAFWDNKKQWFCYFCDTAQNAPGSTSLGCIFHPSAHVGRRHRIRPLVSTRSAQIRTRNWPPSRPKFGPNLHLAVPTHGVFSAVFIAAP